MAKEQQKKTADSAEGTKGAGKPRKKERKNITSAVAHVNSTFNNTITTITDAQGNTISWSSAGHLGFKGSRKSDRKSTRLNSSHRP